MPIQEGMPGEPFRPVQTIYVQHGGNTIEQPIHAGESPDPVPDYTGVNMTPEYISACYRQIIGEGDSLDGYSLEEFLGLPPEIQARAIASKLGR